MSLARWTLPILALLACSSPSPSPSEPPNRQADNAAPPAHEVDKAPSEVALADPREALLSAATVSLLEREHLKKRTLDDALSRDAFKTYVERLDAGKMFLLAKDAKSLEPYADQIDDELHAGRLELAHEGARLFARRLEVVAKDVAELLAGPVDLSNDETIELDPKKIELAETEEELKDRWRRRLELEVMERVSAMETRLEDKKKQEAEKATKAEKKEEKKKEAAQSALAKKADETPEEGEEAAAATVPDQIPPTPEAREAKARADLAVAYAGRFARLRTPGPLDAAADLINAMTSAFDPHTNYLPPADKANFDIQMSGSLEGIGAVLREKDHGVEVVELVPGGASWRQGGLSQGDLILSVANAGKPPVDVTDMPLDDVVKMVRGPKGTVVKLRVRKSSAEETTVSITREKIVIEDAYARGAVLTPAKGKGTYGYIFLPSFYGGQGSGQRTASGDVRHLLDELKEKKVDGVVIDIRSNGGGLLAAAVDITGLLVDRGPVVQVEDSGDRREILSDRDRGTSYDGPVVVLVDRFSASASEIVAGALQDYHRAVIVGTGPTHGKGTVQTLADLDRMTQNTSQLGSLKLTIQQFFRVSGSSTQREGVVPDVVLPDPVAHVEAGEKSLPHAIPWSQIQPADHEDVSHGWKSSVLSTRSAARVMKDPVFAKITARAQLLKTYQDDTRMPLARQAYEDRKKAHKAALEATSANLDKAPPRLVVKMLDEPATKIAPGPGVKESDRSSRWVEGVARDPWIEESLYVLSDMKIAAVAPR